MNKHIITTVSASLLLLASLFLVGCQNDDTDFSAYTNRLHIL